MTDWPAIRGFNYQPSYGSSGLELWQRFSPGTIARELGLGKKHFPGMNAIRLWLSWDAFKRNPPGFAENFGTALDIAAGLGLQVMPVLFNRWHDGVLDYGGIYLDHLLPGASWLQGGDMFGPYLDAIVGQHAADSCILAWDLCNEPFAYGCSPDSIPDIVKHEYAWLESLYRHCKRLGATAPITVGVHQTHGIRWTEETAPLSDILSIHPYWTADSPPHEKAAFEAMLDGYVAFAVRTGKPLLATETCWGSLDDARRVEIICYTLTELRKRGIGWLAYILHHSLIADAHRPEFGPTGPPGNLAFIEADGTLRPGHGIFNEL